MKECNCPPGTCVYNETFDSFICYRCGGEVPEENRASPSSNKPECVKCRHLESEHEEDDKGQCLVENCDCDGLES